MFILDFGSGNTGKNNISYMEHMVNCLSEIDPKRKFIIKWQLFKQAGNNIPLEWEAFDYIYNHTKELGYKTTASVFDLPSLKFLLNYDIPFVKIANRPDLYWLIGEVPRRIPVIISGYGCEYYDEHIHLLKCVSEYPASIDDYERFTPYSLKEGISDHTTNWDLFRRYEPNIYECHYKLGDSTGHDAGPFARTPKQLEEIYNEI